MSLSINIYLFFYIIIKEIKINKNAGKNLLFFNHSVTKKKSTQKHDKKTNQVILIRITFKVNLIFHVK